MNPAAERERGLARHEAVAREVHSHQRRRTGRVNRDGAALQAENVRQPARDHVGGGARPEHVVDLLNRAVHLDGAVVAVRHATEDTGR